LHIDQMVPFGGKMSNESAFNNNRHKNWDLVNQSLITYLYLFYRRAASSWHSDIHTLLQIPDDQQQDFSHLQRGGRMYQSLISSSFEQQKRKRRRLPKLPDEHPADDHMGKSQTGTIFLFLTNFR
jgi:hypothetical protein